jgi:phosphoglycolate phosphatase-like HAD superfamily hydrolase
MMDDPLTAESVALMRWRGVVDAPRMLALRVGRPRQPDAERFLRCYDLDRFFKAMVCMNETPAKPSPEPVRLALQHLGASKALLIGDTVDDMRAATAAGVLAIGVVAPNVADIDKVCLWW